MYKWHIATIRFEGVFPIDMLRYDRCFPWKEADASRIYQSFYDHKGGTVQVARLDNARVAVWTTERWKSFQATVEGGSTE